MLPVAYGGKKLHRMVFGFKRHLIIYDKGEIQNFVFTTGTVDSREPLKGGVLLKNHYNHFTRLKRR